MSPLSVCCCILPAWALSGRSDGANWVLIVLPTQPLFLSHRWKTFCNLCVKTERRVRLGGNKETVKQSGVCVCMCAWTWVQWLVSLEPLCMCYVQAHLWRSSDGWWVMEVVRCVWRRGEGVGWRQRCWSPLSALPIVWGRKKLGGMAVHHWLG